MHMSTHHYRLAELNQDNLEVSAQLIVDALLKNNQVWAALGPEHSQALTFMTAKLREMLNWQQELRGEGIIAKQDFINFVSYSSIVGLPRRKRQGCGSAGVHGAGSVPYQKE